MYIGNGKKYTACQTKSNKINRKWVAMKMNYTIITNNQIV